MMSQPLVVTTLEDRITPADVVVNYIVYFVNGGTAGLPNTGLDQRRIVQPRNKPGWHRVSWSQQWRDWAFWASIRPPAAFVDLQSRHDPHGDQWPRGDEPRADRVSDLAA